MAEKLIEKIDTEEFITLTESKPAILDSTSDEYSDRTGKKGAWMDVLTHFIEDFNEKTPAEKKELWGHP